VKARKVFRGGAYAVEVPHSKSTFDVMFLSSPIGLAMSASISQYGAFEPETTLAMGEAFDEVCRHLHDRGQPKVVRDVIAKQIIEAAKHGERDPARLRDSVMAKFGFNQPNG
jgi:hypothetical protein